MHNKLKKNVGLNPRIDETLFNASLEDSALCEEIALIVDLQFKQVPNSSTALDLLTSYKKIKAEEQRLQEIKRQLLAKQLHLKSKHKEVKKKKKTVANLPPKIADFQNPTQQLEQELELELYNETQKPKTKSAVPTDREKLQVRQCTGLLNCLKPEECANYESCVKHYFTIEMRNEVLTL